MYIDVLSEVYVSSQKLSIESGSFQSENFKTVRLIQELCKVKVEIAYGTGHTGLVLMEFITHSENSPLKGSVNYCLVSITLHLTFSHTLEPRPLN